MTHKIWICAGGTGGHISPGISIANELHTRKNKVHFITLNKNKNYSDIEKIKLHNKFTLSFIDAPKFPTLSLKVVTFFISLIKCFKNFNNLERPDAIIGLGGYPTFPVLAWARLKKIPYFLCEQNAKHGRVTRLMRKKARQVFYSFPLPEKKHHNEKFCGNPLREQFLKAKTKPLKSKIKKILFIGGSQGATDINALYTTLREKTPSASYTFTVISGKSDYDLLTENKNSNDTIISFSDKMPELLNSHDLIISRAGSGLLYEIAWSQRPAILLPYPFASDDHQRTNAIEYSSRHRAEIIDIRPFVAEESAKKVLEILKQENFKNKSKETPLPMDAHKTIVDDVENELSKL